MTAREDLVKDYRAAFFRYLPRREEAALASAYDIGRRAMDGGLTLLDVAEVHHGVLIEVLRAAKPEEIVRLTRAGSEFLLESLAAFDMANRAVTHRPDEAVAADRSATTPDASAPEP